MDVPPAAGVVIPGDRHAYAEYHRAVDDEYPRKHRRPYRRKYHGAGGHGYGVAAPPPVLLLLLSVVVAGPSSSSAVVVVVVVIAAVAVRRRVVIILGRASKDYGDNERR